MVFHRVRRWSIFALAALFMFGIGSLLDNHASQYLVRVPDAVVDSGYNITYSAPHTTAIISNNFDVSKNSKEFIEIPTFIRDIMPSTEEKIFLMETANTTDSTHLNYRVLCSVESWCSANPSHEVWLLVRSTRIWDADGLVQRLLHLCSNLHLARLDPDLILSDTPLYELYISERFSKSLWPASHLSDLLRLGLLWKVGGMYTDSDTVCLRTVAGLTNVIGLGDSNHVAPAIMHFDKDHPFIKRTMQRLLEVYRPWHYITAIEAVQKETWHSCNVTVDKLDTLPLAKTNPCPGFRILPPKAFYPVIWVHRFNIFQPRKQKIQLDKMFNDSYVLHISNGNTFNKSVILDTRSIYETAAERFCPVTFKSISMRTLFF